MNIAEEEYNEDDQLNDQDHLHQEKIELLDKDLNPILYVRDVPSDEFCLILQGKIVVCSGQDGFLLERGPYQTLGVDALLDA